MKHVIDAIYENGNFRPVHNGPLRLTDGQRVRITVEEECEPEALQLATRIYDGLSPDQIDEIEQIALDRGSFFGGRSVN